MLHENHDCYHYASDYDANVNVNEFYCCVNACCHDANLIEFDYGATVNELYYGANVFYREAIVNHAYSLVAVRCTQPQSDAASVTLTDVAFLFEINGCLCRYQG